MRSGEGRALWCRLRELKTRRIGNAWNWVDQVGWRGVLMVVCLGVCRTSGMVSLELSMGREIDAIQASTESILNWINRSRLLSNRSNSGKDVLHLHTSIRCRSKRNSGSIVGFQISSHRWVTGYTVSSGSRSTAKQSRNVGNHQDTATGSINCSTTISKTAQSHSPSLVGHHDQASNRPNQISSSSSSSSTLSSAQCASSTSGISKNPSESELRTLKVERMHLPFFFLPLRQTVLVLWCFLAFFL